MALKLNEKESRTVINILDSELENVVLLIKKSGYDTSSFFTGGDARGIDFRGSDIKGVSFRDTDLRGCVFLKDQYKSVIDSKPSSIDGAQFVELDSDFDIINYNKLIGEAKDLSSARRVWDRMRSSGVEASDATLASLVSKSKSVSDARRVISELDPLGATTNTETYNALIGKCKKHEDSSELLAEMRKKSIPPSTETFHRVISNSRFSDGIALIVQMDREGIQINSPILATLVAKAPTPVAARTMFGEALSRSIPIDRNLVNAVLVKCTSLEDARNVLSMVNQEIVKPDTQTFNTLLSFDSSFEDAIGIFNEMVSLSVIRNSVTFLRLIRKATNLEEAAAVAAEAEQSDASISKEVEREIEDKLRLFEGLL